MPAKTVTAILALLGLATLFATHIWAQERSTIEVTGEELASAFVENTFAAEAKYKNDQPFLVVDGAIEAIGKDKYGNPYMDFEPGMTTMLQARCVLDTKNDKEAIGLLAKLSKGERVKVLGIIAPEAGAFGGPILYPCFFDAGFAAERAGHGMAPAK
jgi:hypothetical protein